MQTDTPQQETQSRRDMIFKEAVSFLKSLLLAIVVVLLVTTFVFQIVYVEGGSMRNTLQDGEIMLVTKYQYYLHAPERFDVVVCRYPDRGNINFVKRIVGVPGDTVAMEGGILYVNGEPIEEGYIDFPSGYTLQETVIAPDHYFVMGDNRASSNDSRNAQVGQLTRQQISGRVRLVFWPLSEMRVIH